MHVTDSGYAKGTLSSNRSYYRNAYAYQQQVSRNSTFFNKQKGFAGSSYDSAGRKPQQRPTVLSVTRSLDRLLQEQRDRRTKQLGIGGTFGLFVRKRRILKRRRVLPGRRRRTDHPWLDTSERLRHLPDDDAEVRQAARHSLRAVALRLFRLRFRVRSADHPGRNAH